MTVHSVILLLLTSIAESQSAFESARDRILSLDLDQARPPAATPLERAAVLDSLPKQGQIHYLRPPARRKLASLEPIFRRHHRESVYVVQVIAVRQAYVGIHGRAVILISEAALTLLEPEELQAVVAHEIGHEYAWEEFEAAKQGGDHRRLRELEFFADGVAVLTLRALGLDPFRLIAACRKVGRFNTRQLGRASNEDSYPSIRDRKKFAELLLKNRN